MLHYARLLYQDLQDGYKASVRTGYSVILTII